MVSISGSPGKAGGATAIGSLITTRPNSGSTGTRTTTCGAEADGAKAAISMAARQTIAISRRFRITINTRASVHIQ